MAKAISEDIGAFGAYKFIDRYEAPFYNTKWVSADEKRGDDLVATTSFALGEKFGTYTLPLPDASWLEYEVSLVTRPSGEQVQSARFAIGRPGPKGSEKLSNFVTGADFSLGQFNNPSVESYSGGYIIVHTGGGHEGIDRKFLFDPVRMTLSDIYADLEKRTIGYRAYPIFTSVIVGGQLVLEEHRSCCDMVYDPNGHERLVYDLATMKLVSRKPLETLVPPTAKLLRKSGKSVTFATGGYVESEDFGQSVHPVGDDSKDESYRVLNTSFLTKFYRSYKSGYEPMTFKSVSGTAYTDTDGRQYIIIESIVPEA